MKMKASRIHQFGPPEVIALEEIDRPVPGDGEVLVRVKAAGVGPWDALIRTGKSGLPQPLPLTLGSDLSGVVEAIGGGQPTFEPGEEVFGVTNARFTDAYAEYAIASAHMIACKPRTVDDLQAASVPVIAVTAWQMLFDRAQLMAGQTVLVHGGAGNVGAYAVQLAHREQARVIATASADAAEFVRGLGADDVIDFHAGRIEERVEKSVGQVDVVIDTVGGDTQRRSLAVVKPGGILVSVVSQPDEQEASRRHVRTSYFIVEVTSRQLAQIASLIDAGEIKTSVGTVLPLAQAQRAHEMLAGKVPHARGKIVLNVAA